MSLAIKAFLLAASLAAVTATVVLALYSSVWAPDASWTLSDVKMLAVVLVYCLVISLIALAVVAIPVTLLLSRFGLERSWVYPSLGFGTAILILWQFEERPSDLIESHELIATLGLGIAGALAGAIWWSLFRVRHAETK